MCKETVNNGHCFLSGGFLIPDWATKNQAKGAAPSPNSKGFPWVWGRSLHPPTLRAAEKMRRKGQGSQPSQGGATIVPQRRT
jgi:hypothetical protein